MEESHTEGGAHHPLGYGPGLNRGGGRRKSGSILFSLLSGMPCDALLHHIVPFMIDEHSKIPASLVLKNGMKLILKSLISSCIRWVNFSSEA